jgi:methylated-DNA-protein-cysteine methyltransferase related protein
MSTPWKSDVRALLFPLRKARSRSVDGENEALQTIWDVVARIPRGRVSTYGSVARAAGLPGRARQAGYALKHMPDDLQLPWHRVVGAGGKIVFPRGSKQHREQARLLRSEGVAVNDGRVSRDALTDLEDLWG